MSSRYVLTLVSAIPVMLSFPIGGAAQTRVDRALSVQANPASRVSQPLATVTAPAPTANRPIAAVGGPRGAYTSDAMGPSILARNADYETTFRKTVVVPQGATISNVSWRYGLSSRPAEFEAMLCLPRRLRCWNVTDHASGNTSIFNGQDATLAFTLHYRVTGRGPLGAPVRGEMNQLIVTYALPD